MKEVKFNVIVVNQPSAQAVKNLNRLIFKLLIAKDTHQVNPANQEGADKKA